MFQTSWHTYDHYGYAFIALVGTFFAVTAIQWFIQRSRWAPWPGAPKAAPWWNVPMPC